MFKKTLISLAVASSLGLTGCFDSGETGANANPDYKISNPAIDGKTWPLFNGVSRQFPVPNDILFALETAGDGTMVDGTDPENPVTTGIGFMDGNSVASAFDIKISGSLDANQKLDARSFVTAGSSVIPNPNQNVFLLPLEYPGQDPLASAKGEIPSFAGAVNYQVAAGLLAAGQTATATSIFSKLAMPVARAEIITLDEGVNNVIRINPITPLEPKTKYLVVVTNGVQDASGEPLVGSPSYQNYSNPNEPLGTPDLAPFRNAILNWETLAAGYFGFMQSVFDKAGVEATAPSKDDIVFSMTFTTTGVEDVLTANAAPRKFFENSQRIDARQDAISKLIDGTFNLTDQGTSSTEPGDSNINTRIYELLTDPANQFRLFNADLAATLSSANAGAVTLTYKDVAVSSDGELNTTLAFALQTAASQAAIDVKGAIIAGQATAVEGGFVNTLGVLEAPQARAVNFYSTDEDASSINPALRAPAKVSQGDITLPYFLEIPADNTNGSVIRTSNWTTNQADNLQSPPGGSLPEVVAPSDKITYRFPFAGEIGETTVPVLVTYPNAAATAAVGITKPLDGWPVIIYQHGITTDRSATLPLANALSFACVDTGETPENPLTWTASGNDCFATIAIDQPLHGVVPTGSVVPGLSMIKNQSGTVTPGASAGATERHFNFSANAELEPTPMSALPDGAEASGSLFINLSNFANSRDNLRQGVLDLLNLNASIEGLDIDGVANGADLDPNRVYFVGHSLGGVNGLPFVSVNNSVAGDIGTVNEDLPPIQAAAVLNSGGGVTKLLENSPSTSFGAPAILAGLAAASDGVLVQGSSSLETYFAVLQGLIDSTDPVNFGDSLSSFNILLTEIVGDGTSDNPSDQTIPNAADADLYGQGPLELTLSNGFVIDSLPAPLAGTEPTIAQIGATPSADGALPAVTRFTAGSHGTPVSADNGAVFQEMVDQIAELFTSGTISVTNSTVVESN
ncbi:Ig-like domain-containing protein [Marinobacter sp.]|uniref:Ig-like domain-containing protein n=1 Tax=Marinobacter sp. TaxID=50741 RepID=UPI003A949E7B